MKDFIRNLLTFLLMCVLALTLFYLCGNALDGILYGHWPENDDHPTNWLDSSKQPEPQ